MITKNPTKRPLWIPSEERKAQANLTRFMDRINRAHGLHIDTCSQLHDWSVTEIADFWGMMWEFAEIKASRGYEAVLDDVARFPGAKWFSGAELNFAENLLRFRDDRTAFIFRGETQKSQRMTYAPELYDAVARLASSLHALGVSAGDRVVGYMPNLIETAVAMLATASIGAVWSSCATDVGPSVAQERLGQNDLPE